MRIRIQKRAEVSSGLPANPREAHVDGQTQNENFSLPIDYWVEGELLQGITVGESVVIARETRNGVVAMGMMTTSPVVEVRATSFSTKNSVYDYVLTPGATRV
jgi:hypothetical protein